ncbi:hypothetical protein K2173_004584 [Erythroxylum novogranatense]|uniref:Uncharacterized protein n=1 Tax=Erythroxylum novogranatense TaxID=1862640 RepID=A0AAV8T5D5_9ROSI|nr:hypothetical protein K2173_004584 [Erythroxylum novogranatense]
MLAINVLQLVKYRREDAVIGTKDDETKIKDDTRRTYERQDPHMEDDRADLEEEENEGNSVQNEVGGQERWGGRRSTSGGGRK